MNLCSLLSGFLPHPGRLQAKSRRSQADQLLPPATRGHSATQQPDPNVQQCSTHAPSLPPPRNNISFETLLPSSQLHLPPAATAPRPSAPAPVISLPPSALPTVKEEEQALVAAARPPWAAAHAPPPAIEQLGQLPAHAHGGPTEFTYICRISAKHQKALVDEAKVTHAFLEDACPGNPAATKLSDGLAKVAQLGDAFRRNLSDPANEQLYLPNAAKTFLFEAAYTHEKAVTTIGQAMPGQIQASYSAAVELYTSANNYHKYMDPLAYMAGLTTTAVNTLKHYVSKFVLSTARGCPTPPVLLPHPTHARVLPRVVSGII